MLSFLMKADQFTQITLLEKLTDFQNVIVIKEGLMSPLHEAVMHHIDTENQKISYKLFYNLFSYELKVLHEYLDDALIKGWIQHSMSSVDSLILFILKKDESLQLCINYWNLNKKMIKNCHSLPLIEETLNHLMRFYYFMKLNLKDTYHWIQITERDWWKTAFYIRYRHFEYLVMSFDLVNTSVTFQTYINKALWHLVDIIYVIYLNDILIYFTIRKQYVKNVCAVFL